MSMHLTFLISLCMGALLCAQAPQAPLVTTSSPNAQPLKLDPRKITAIADDVKVLEEETLLNDASLQGTDGMKGKLASMDPTAGHFDPNTGKTIRDTPESELQDDAPSAMRLYGFKLKPGEDLKFKLTADSRGQIVMGFPIPNNPGAMLSQLKRANGLPKPIRFRKIELSNVTKEPYLAVLMLRGQAGYKYKLEIERRGGK